MALSQVLGIVRSGIVPLLDGLESKGLLKRMPSAADRRSHALYLTLEGDAFLDRADTLVQEHENRLIKKVGTRHHQQLLQILGVFGKRK
jgi:DNA-binding MarR family transcriptional regulator